MWKMGERRRFFFCIAVPIVVLLAPSWHGPCKRTPVDLQPGVSAAMIWNFHLFWERLLAGGFCFFFLFVGMELAFLFPWDQIEAPHGSKEAWVVQQSIFFLSCSSFHSFPFRPFLLPLLHFLLNWMFAGVRIKLRRGRKEGVEQESFRGRQKTLFSYLSLSCSLTVLVLPGSYLSIIFFRPSDSFGIPLCLPSFKTCQPPPVPLQSLTKRHFVGIGVLKSSPWGTGIQKPRRRPRHEAWKTWG